MTKVLLLSLFLIGCYRVPAKIEPQMNYSITNSELKNKTSAFDPLSKEELNQPWAKEMIIAQAFSKECDLYRAVSTYKRAEILIDKDQEDRLRQIEYSIVLCYFLAQKYNDAITTFETSELLHVDKSFPAFCDLLTLLYESYLKTEDHEKATRILELIQKSDSKRENNLALYTAIQDANIPLLSNRDASPVIKNSLDYYCTNKKSPATAGALNAILPGAGFLYLGQKRSALTALLLNGLFIGATYQFFHKDYVAAGLITLSFECGWYFGGIYGAQEEAKLYNERLYEGLFCSVLNQNKLFPIFMIKHTF